MISTKQRLAAASIPKAEILTPGANSTDNKRPLAVSGTRDPATCTSIKVEVTFFDANGMPVGGVYSVEPTIDPTNPEFWDAEIPVPEEAVSCSISVTCSGVVQSTVTGVAFTTVLVQTGAGTTPRGPVFFASKTGTNDLTMTVDNPAAADPADCDTITVLHHVGHGETYAFLPHYHTPFPGPGKRTITYHGMSNGRYSTRLVYLPARGQPVTYSPPMVKIP